MSEATVPDQAASRFFRNVGSLAIRAARGAGEGIAAAYLALDADIPRHLAELPLVGLVSLGARHVPAAALPDDGCRPVIFVHGLGGFRGNFSPMRLFLRLQGRSRTYAVGFPSGSDLETMAADLRRFIAEVIFVNQLPEGSQIDLVAHSMGGLVTRLALEDEQTRARVATLVTMGTPHAGTFAARYAQTKFILALRPDSDFIRRLQKQVPWTNPPRLVTFWSKSDLLLLPPSTACVEGAENIEMPGLTHYGYLLQPSCFRRLSEALSPPALAATRPV